MLLVHHFFFPKEKLAGKLESKYTLHIAKVRRMGKLQNKGLEKKCKDQTKAEAKIKVKNWRDFVKSYLTQFLKWGLRKHANYKSLLDTCQNDKYKVYFYQYFKIKSIVTKYSIKFIQMMESKGWS